VVADVAIGNVVMLDRYRERRTTQEARLQAFGQHLPPTPAG